MPKQNKQSGIKDGEKSKGKGKKVDVVGNEADDDFDTMLAELRASDPPSSTITNTTTTTGSSSTGSSSSSGSSRTAQGTPVTEAMIIQASSEGDVAQLRRWAKRGVRVSSGEPLRQAVLGNQIGAVRCLVKDLGADVNQADEDDYTPLRIAAHSGNLDMLRCVATELGADVNRGDEAGSTPLHIAAQSGHLAFVRCLIKDLGADVNRRKKNSFTPLHIATQMGHLDVVQCLVDELGADLNEPTVNGTTPLMLAAGILHHEIVRYFLKKGADAQASHSKYGTAADASERANAPAEETAYLQARTHCANPSCTNAGLKKCERCLKVYFCGNACIRAHWPAHKAECTAAAAKLKAGREASSSSSSSSASSSSS
jgi:hypothetical protein